MIISKYRHVSSVVRGVDHAQSGSVCQDNVYYLNNNGIHVLALSDGAGSKQYSQIGSKLVTKEVCEYMIKEFDSLLLVGEKYGKTPEEIEENERVIKNSIFNHLKKRLLEKVNELNNIEIDDLACTLLFVAIKGDKYIMGHIGDGVIGGLFNNGKNQVLKVLSHPENGHQINITYFLTDPGANDHFRITHGNFVNLTGIIMMSDGPEEVLYHPVNGLDNKLQQLFNSFNKYTEESCNKILEKFLTNQIAKYSFDDLSVNILHLSRIYLSTASKEVFLDFFKDIFDEDQQIIKQSSYGIFLDNSKFYSFKENKIKMELMKKYYEEDK